MPDHLDINRHPGIDIIFCLLADPGGPLANDALTHGGTLVGRQKGGHLI